ncbi:MAG: hypothetical protein K8L97_20565 [Anaerolineae bacterium]|nr:hypothetical protein [Anaerolineae bacterium]
MAVQLLEPVHDPLLPDQEVRSGVIFEEPPVQECRDATPYQRCAMAASKGIEPFAQVRKRYDDALAGLTQLAQRLHHHPLGDSLAEEGFAVDKAVEPPQEVVFPTRWAGEVSLETLLTDPQVRRVAYAKAISLGLDADDQDDCVQSGYIKLWQTVLKNPTILADKGPGWVGVYVAYSGNPSQFQRRQARQRCWMETVAGVIRQGQRRERWAQWARWVDEAIDLEWLMQRMAQRYADTPRKLFGLYAITTEVNAKDVASAAGMHEKNFAAGVGNAVRRDLQAQFPEVQVRTAHDDWQKRLARGEGLEHVIQVAEAVIDNPRLLFALYVVTTSVTKKAVMETFCLGHTVFGEAIQQVKSMLAAAYRQTNRHGSRNGGARA